MIYNSRNNVRVLEAVKSVQEGLWRIAHLPLLKSDEAADKFVNGYNELMAMPKEKRDKFGAMSAKELRESGASSEVQNAVSIMGEALKSVSDATAGRAMRNEFISTALKTEKAFHTEARTNFEQAVQLVDELSSMTQENGIDAGWMLAYRNVGVYGKDEMQVNDVLGRVRFNQLSKTERAILTGLGTEESEKVGYDRFGGGVEYNTYDMPNSAYTVNEVLSAIRVAALQLQAWVAYKNLFRHDSENVAYAYTAHPQAGTNTTTKDKVFNQSANAIHSLNEAFRQMKLEAGQIRKSPKKKGTDNQDKAPLMVTPQTTGLVYFNESHVTLIDQLRRMIGGDDGINIRLLHNFVFMPTHLAPISGGWTVSDEKERDDHGAYGIISEKASISKAGVRLVIPGQRNLHGMFQDLTFGEEMSFLDETNKIVAYKREKFVVDPRQSAMVTLEA